MGGRLAGKSALITAAGQGIGTRDGAGDGARRRAGARDRHRLRSCSTRLPARRTSARARLDVLDDAAVTKTIESRCRRCRSCSTAQATSTTAPSSTARPKDWEFSFNLNVRAMYMTIQCSAAEDARHQKTGAGSIINMASIARSIKGLPNRFVYGTTQGGRHRPDQGRGRRFRRQGHPLQRDRAGHRRHAVAGRSGSTLPRTRWRRARSSSPASRWDGSRRPRKSRRWSCSSRPTSRHSSPATSIPAMAG